MSDDEGIRDELQKAIDDVLANRGEMSGHWIALVETFSADGMRSVYMAADQASTSWDAMGFLQYGLTMEKVHVAKCHDNDD